MSVRDRNDYVWTIHSTTFEEKGSDIGMCIAPFDIHIMHKMKRPAKRVKKQSGKEA